VVLALGALAAPVHGEILRVPDDFSTIQAAIDGAVAGDEVVVDDGVHTGAGNLDLDFGGRAITVRSAHGPGSCVIDGQGVSRVFVFQNAETRTSIIDGFTIRHGSAWDGGAVLCTAQSSPTIRNCVFVNNAAHEWGGAVYCFVDCDPLIEGCVFSGNRALLGGAIGGEFSDMTIAGCEFTGNVAAETPDLAAAGGAVMLWRSYPSITRCVFRKNIAEGAGGAIHAHKSNIAMESCLLYDNTAWWGGAYYGNPVSKPRILVSTFVGNIAQFDGGAIYATHGGALIGSCILRGNAAGSGQGDQVYGGAPVVFSNVRGGSPGLGNIDVDPRFIDAAGSDFRLRADSPCIDAGHNWAAAGLADSDLDGNPRFADEPQTPATGCGMPVVVDMGAYEFRGVPADVRLGDVDADGVVGILDFLKVLAAWGEFPEACRLADVDPDGEIGVGDVLVVLANWSVAAAR
jgi:predicted outer membrane repeat protein